MTATDSTANGAGASAGTDASNTAASDAERAATVSDSVTGAPACPKCGGKMWDNRATKRNPKAPDFKCRDRRCDGVLWPGQHKSAEPILTPRVPVSATETPADGTSHEPEAHRAAAATEAATEAGQGSASRGGCGLATTTAAVRVARVALRRCYLDVTDFVLSEVRPKYADAGLPCTDATVAAIAATLFIQTCRPTTTAAGREGQ